MKESLAKAVNTSDLRQRDRPCPIDKLTTLAYASIQNSVGSDAIRFMWGLQPKSYDALLIGLARKLRNNKHFRQTSKEMRYKISAMIVEEETLPSCKVCFGAKELRGENIIKVCPCCGGSGVHRYTDSHRSMTLQIDIQDYKKNWSSLVSKAKDIYTAQINNTLHIAYQKNN